MREAIKCLVRPLVADDCLAVIGLACRLPGAPDPETFWRNLHEGVEALEHFSETELLASGIDRKWFEPCLSG